MSGLRELESFGPVGFVLLVVASCSADGDHSVESDSGTGGSAGGVVVFGGGPGSGGGVSAGSAGRIGGGGAGGVTASDAAPTGCASLQAVLSGTMEDAPVSFAYKVGTDALRVRPGWTMHVSMSVPGAPIDSVGPWAVLRGTEPGDPSRFSVNSPMPTTGWAKLPQPGGGAPAMYCIGPGSYLTRGAGEYDVNLRIAKAGTCPAPSNSGTLTSCNLINPMATAPCTEGLHGNVSGTAVDATLAGLFVGISYSMHTAFEGHELVMEENSAKNAVIDGLFAFPIDTPQATTAYCASGSYEFVPSTYERAQLTVAALPDCSSLSAYETLSGCFGIK